MSEGVDTAVNEVKSPAPSQTPDALRSHAEGQKLAMGKHAELPFREADDINPPRCVS